VQLLIERGHSFTEVKGYTLRQLREFTDAAERARRRAMVDDLVNLRASQYDKNSYRDYLRKLSTDDG
jgi:gamma-glutamylcysteine synthetase